MPLHPENKENTKQTEKVTTFFFFGSGRKVMFQGKPLPPKLEGHRGRHWESWFTGAETSVETNGRVGNLNYNWYIAGGLL